VKKIGLDAFGMCQKLSLVKMARTTDISEMPFLHDTHPKIEYYE